MRVFYHSALRNEELTAGCPLRTVPCKSFLELRRDKNESQYDILLNGELLDSDVTRIECNEEAELVIFQKKKKYIYSVRPLFPILSQKYAKSYEQFHYECKAMEFGEIESIQLGRLKLYAVDQSTEIYDWTSTFDKIEEAYSAFKIICERPKSHLKAVNEVRPIETVKRIGYESIPYLAAHSEDWMARTASGLKPARLFSRVEDDEFQIYENRVVKTLIDLILGFLRRTEKTLRDQRDQLQGIMNSSVQTGSFGFDVSFQKAVAELMSSDDRGDEYRSKSFELVDKLQKRAYILLKKYRTLRQSKLYRYLRKTRSVANPLNETNILTMDKQYSVIFRLWRTIHHVITPMHIEDEEQIAFDNVCDDYRQYCISLCGYAAHVLGFEQLDSGCYKRNNDSIAIDILGIDDGSIRVTLSDVEPRHVEVTNGVYVPIMPGTTQNRISYDGHVLSLPNDLTLDEIDAFCGLLKTKESRGKEQYEEQKKYAALKGLIDSAQRSYDKPASFSFRILPMAVELSTENRVSFIASIKDIAEQLLNGTEDEQLVIVLPVCNENEQKVISYAKEINNRVSILPVTMFDINSFRRIQNVLYRYILKLDKGCCLNCGGSMRKRDNQFVCDACNQLVLTKTICPNPGCKHEYYYLGYEVSSDTITKMKAIRPENFYQWDSLYQYKDIVNMTVESGKIRAVCPCCGQS